MTLPATLRHVEKAAFVSSQVTSLTLPDDCESMDNMAFWNKHKLTRVDLGGTKLLPDSAFRYNRELAEVNFHPDLNRLTRVGDYAFEDAPITSVTLPESVTSIGKFAFSDNSSLTRLHLDSGRTSIGEGAFVGATSLTSLTVARANPVYSVDGGVLYQKSIGGKLLVLSLPTNGATEFTVPDGTVAIAHSAFVSNTSLRRVVLPDGLTRIEYGTFDGCDNLTDIVIPNSVTVARGLVNNGLDTVELGSKVTELWMTPRDTTTPRHIIVRGGNNGEFYYEGKASNGRPDSAYFGEGMTSFTFWFDTSRVLVLPSTVKDIKLAEDMASDLKANTEIYVAAPKGSKAWTLTEAAMKEAGYNMAALFEYTRPQVAVSGNGINEAGPGYTLTSSVGTPTTVKVSAQGGTLGGRQMRVVQIGADGTETVLQDWDSMQGSSDESASTRMCRAITHPHAAQHFRCEESEPTMFHYRRVALTLITDGALAFTTTGVPAAFGADADATQASSPQQASDDSPSTIIVQLDARDDGTDRAAYYAQMKTRIGEAVAAARPGATISDVRDYLHAFDGFAIQAPASTLRAIQATAGVKGAFLDGDNSFVTDEEINGQYRAAAGGGDSGITPGAAAQMMRANAASQKGQGKVIELIDSGIDTLHEAFAGDLDAASLRLTQDAAASLTSQLGAGKAGVWVSPKIPFAYDYGDGDTDVLATHEGDEYARAANTQGTRVATLVRQRVASDPAFAGLSDGEKNAVVTKLLMGTARPITDAQQDDGTFYSPRRVGAGLVDAAAATTSFVYPTVVGAANPSRPKADLGEGTSGWSFQVTLTNVSDTARTFTLGGQALSEKVESMLLSHHSTNWAGKGIDLTFSADSVTVPAKGESTVTVTVTPREAFASYVAANTPKGTFIDGAVTFTSTDGAPNLTVPYMGFYGSWGAPAIFDQVTPNNHISGYGSTFMDGNLPCGQQSPFDVEDERMINGVDPDLFIITRSTDENARRGVRPGTVLLRSVSSLTYTFTNEAGQTIRTFTWGSADRSIYDVQTRSPRTVEDSVPGCAPWFSGYAPDGSELPDGRYTLTIEGTTEGPSPSTQQISYGLTLDTKAPVISNVTVSGDGNDRTLSFDVADSSPISAVGFSATADGPIVERGAEVYPTERGEDGLVHRHFDVPLTDALASIGGDPSSIYLHVWDWPVNKGTAPFTLKAIPMTSLALSQTSATLSVGETLTLSATHEPADANVTALSWSSSDEAVATVSATGEVSAVGAGDATITVTDPTQPSVTASATIHVSAPAPAAKAGTWKRDGRGWWYRYEDGTYPTDTTLAIDGATYRFDARGYMRTGWVEEQGSWYYLKTGSGAMATGRLRIFWTWYTFSETGQLIS